MSEAKSYKKQEVSEDYVAEPMAMKYSAVAEDAGYLNDDILVDAIKYTQTAREKGQMIPYSRKTQKIFKKDSKNIQERLKKYSRKGRIITPQTEFDTTLSCCYSYNP